MLAWLAGFNHETECREAELTSLNRRALKFESQYVQHSPTMLLPQRTGQNEQPYDTRTIDLSCTEKGFCRTEHAGSQHRSHKPNRTSYTAPWHGHWLGTGMTARQEEEKRSERSGQSLQPDKGQHGRKRKRNLAEASRWSLLSSSTCLFTIIKSLSSTTTTLAPMRPGRGYRGYRFNLRVAPCHPARNGDSGGIRA